MVISLTNSAILFLFTYMTVQFSRKPVNASDLHEEEHERNEDCWPEQSGLRESMLENSEDDSVSTSVDFDILSALVVVMQ